MKKIIVVLSMILSIPALAENSELTKILYGKFNIYTYLDDNIKNRKISGTITFDKGVGVITRVSDNASSAFTYEALSNNILCIRINKRSKMCYTVAPGKDIIAIFHRKSILSDAEIDSIDSLERVK